MKLMNLKALKVDLYLELENEQKVVYFAIEIFILSGLIFYRLTIMMNVDV